MKRYIVNVVERKVIPFVVEANDEWEAMMKAADDDGYVHNYGATVFNEDPQSWEIEEYSEAYPAYSQQYLQEFI